MISKDAKRIGSLSLIVLLLSTVHVIINSTIPALAEGSTTSSSGSDEVAAASGSNRFVVWSDETPGNWEIFFRRSTDSGASWQSKVNLSNNPGSSDSPLIRVFGSHVYVAWRQVIGSSVDIFLRHSSDNGVTWKSPVNISQSFGNSHLQQLAASGSNVYVTWEDDTLGNSEILFRRSTDNGATWKAVKNLSLNSGRSELPQIAAAGSNVYVVWDDDTPGNDEIFFRKSTDNGATWGPTVNLSINPGGSNPPFVRIAVSGSNVYVVWGQTNKAQTAIDVFFRRSTDNGVSWMSKVNLSNDGASGAPEIAVSGSNVYVVWQRSVEGERPDILFQRSANNGATWKPRVNLSNDPSGSQDHEIVARGPNVYVIWHGYTDGNNNILDVLFIRSADNGATWKSVKNLSNNPTNSHSAHVAAFGSEVYVVWSDLISFNYDIFLKRSTNSGATFSFKNLSNTAGSSFNPQIAV